MDEEADSQERHLLEGEIMAEVIRILGYDITPDKFLMMDLKNLKTVTPTQRTRLMKLSDLLRPLLKMDESFIISELGSKQI